MCPVQCHSVVPVCVVPGEEAADRQTVPCRQRETAEDPPAHGNGPHSEVIDNTPQISRHIESSQTNKQPFPVRLLHRTSGKFNVTETETESHDVDEVSQTDVMNESTW